MLVNANQPFFFLGGGGGGMQQTQQTVDSEPLMSHISGEHHHWVLPDLCFTIYIRVYFLIYVHVNQSLNVRYIYTYLAILCDLFGKVKWPFQSLSDLQLLDKKVTLNHLLYLYLCLSIIWINQYTY